MPKSTPLNPNEQSQLATELLCYLEATPQQLVLEQVDSLTASYQLYSATEYRYQLLTADLNVLEVVLYLPSGVSLAMVESMRLAVVKSAIDWSQSYHLNSQINTQRRRQYDVLVLDIQLTDDNADSATNDSDASEVAKAQASAIKRLSHHFSAQYFMEDIILDTEQSQQFVQIFGWQDWQMILQKVQTTAELGRFLHYHLDELEHSISKQTSSFDSIDALLETFINNGALFEQAIQIDNALIKNAMQDKPNSALVAMTLAQKSKSATTQMYHQHLSQACALWSQLSMQMIEVMQDQYQKDSVDSSNQPFTHWQQQLLAESLFSRHELVRTLYKHPNQSAELLRSGYVVHQHSYENLGRHYLLIFYSQEKEGKNSRSTIQPNLQKIALETATRIPLAELHHVIVLGITLIAESDDSVMDIDLWIQPVNAMTQKERQLTKQIQRLQQRHAEQQQVTQPHKRSSATTASNQSSSVKPASVKSSATDLPSLQINLSIPARRNKT